MDGLDSVTFLGGLSLEQNEAPTIDFTALSHVVTIDGDVHVESTYAFATDFSGFEGVTSVAANFETNLDPDTTSFDGLRNLLTIGGEFETSRGDPSDFASLESIGGSLTFSNLHDSSLTGLPALTSAGTSGCRGTAASRRRRPRRSGTRSASATSGARL